MSRSRFLSFLEGLDDFGYLLLQLSFESLEKLKVLSRFFDFSNFEVCPPSTDDDPAVLRTYRSLNEDEGKIYQS